MDHAILALTAFLVSGLTLFSGFGLGTLLMPAFAVVFPVPAAIAATAVVHLANNLFKLALLGRRADWRVVLRFGLPAALAASLGASLLVGFAGLGTLATWSLRDTTFEITAVKLVIGTLIVVFAALELSPGFAALSVPSRYLPLGGLLSGFFGGLSGNQGAFRAAFLIKAGLDKQAFVATGVVCAVIVDVVRLSVYGTSYLTARLDALPPGVTGVVITASLAAFAGAFLGARLLQKITLRTVQLVVAFGMVGVGTGLAAGLL